MPRRRLLLSVLLVTVLASPSIGQPASLGSGRVEGAPALNVRAGPGTQHAPVGALRSGDTVEVLELGGDEGKWARVRYRDGVGWVFATYIVMREGGAPRAAPTATATTAPTATPIVPGASASVPGDGGEAHLAAPPVSAAAGLDLDDLRGDVDRILTLTEAMHHDLERQRNSPPSATRGEGISFQSGMGLLALGAVIGLLIGTIIGRQQERRGRPRVRL